MSSIWKCIELTIIISDEFCNHVLIIIILIIMVILLYYY